MSDTKTFDYLNRFPDDIAMIILSYVFHFDKYDSDEDRDENISIWNVFTGTDIYKCGICGLTGESEDYSLTACDNLSSYICESCAEGKYYIISDSDDWQALLTDKTQDYEDNELFIFTDGHMTPRFLEYF